MRILMQLRNAIATCSNFYLFLLPQPASAYSYAFSFNAAGVPERLTSAVAAMVEIPRVLVQAVRRRRS